MSHQYGRECPKELEGERATDMSGTLALQSETGAEPCEQVDSELNSKGVSMYAIRCIEDADIAVITCASSDKQWH